MIIDSHVHFPFSLEIPESDWGAYLVDRAARCGINALIVSDVFIRGSADAGSYPSPAAVCRANSYAAEQSRKNQGRLYFLAYLNPQNANWEEELERAAAAGAVGVKLWVSLKDDSGSLDRSIAVLRKAAAMDLPVLIHVFSTAGPNSRGEINISEFAELSRQVPECVLVGGHSGANFRESLGVLDQVSENTFWDISGTNPDRSMVPELVRAAGAGKILFGSDGPGRSFASQLHKVTLAPISQKEKEQILRENILKVYHLPGIHNTPIVPPKSELLLPPDGEDHFLFCGRWPFFEKGAVEAEELEKLLETHGITRGLTVSFDAMFRSDLLRANREFRKVCEKLQRVRPLAVIDPEARNLQALIEDAAASGDAGVWFSPALLGEEPDSPQALRLYRECARYKLPVYLNGRLGEARFRHRSLVLRNLEFKDLEGFFRQAPEHDYIIQGIAPAAEIPRSDCRFTFERLSDTERGIENFLSAGGKKSHLLRGSEFPFRELEQTFLAANGKPSAEFFCL